jgi:hypothetical protein
MKIIKRRECERNNMANSGIKDGISGEHESCLVLIDGKFSKERVSPPKLDGRCVTDTSIHKRKSSYTAGIPDKLAFFQLEVLSCLRSQI